MDRVQQIDGQLVWTPREARESTNGTGPGATPDRSAECSTCGQDVGEPAPAPEPTGRVSTDAEADTGPCPQGPLRSAFAQAGSFVASGFSNRPTCPWAWAVLLGAVLATVHMLTREG